MTDKQQTAVQWFANQLGITTGTMFKHAIEMEKKQRQDMKIKIKETKSGRYVYIGRNRIGLLRKFCCGIDFKPINKPNCLFSILGMKNYDDKLIMCIEKIISLNIPDKSFHWNFNYDIAKDDKKMKSYQLELDKL